MKMIFVDNDNIDRATSDFESFLKRMEIYDVDTTLFDEVEIVPRFVHMEIDEQYDLILGADVILTHSMFTVGHHGSKGQLRLMMSGINRYKPEGGLIYIDTGSYLSRTLNNCINDGILKNNVSYAIQCAIYNNYIITVGEDEMGVGVGVCRLELSFNTLKPLRGVEVDLKKLLKS